MEVRAPVHPRPQTPRAVPLPCSKALADVTGCSHNGCLSAGRDGLDGFGVAALFTGFSICVQLLSALCASGVFHYSEQTAKLKAAACCSSRCKGDFGVAVAFYVYGWRLARVWTGFAAAWRENGVFKHPAAAAAAAAAELGAFW